MSANGMSVSCSTKFNSPSALSGWWPEGFLSSGEVAVAKAAKARGYLQILLTVTSSAVEDAIGAAAPSGISCIRRTVSTSLRNL
jgi:isopentenyl diphosphate isomerase/L-lactate dehydrogenase-like FMN-dependent dehydrogenase